MPSSRFRFPVLHPLRWLPAPSLALLCFLCGSAFNDAAAQFSDPGSAPPQLSAPPADTTSEANLTVGVIRVRGNTFTDSARVVRSFEVASGSRYSADAVRRGIRKLFTLGLFEDVFVSRLIRGSTVDLEVNVVERQRLASIEFSGNKKKDTSDLEKKLFLRVGEPYSANTVQTQIDTLLRYYRDEGFGRAAVTASIDTSLGARRVGLRFAISEGEKVRITKIEFAGAHAFPAKKLRKVMKTKQKGFFGGGEVKEEQYAEDIEKLRAQYRNNGYRDVKVTGPELLPTAKPRDLTMVYTIEEGRSYRMGQLSWSGNTVVPTETLDRVWKRKGPDTYDRSAIERAQGGAYAEYAEHGYLYLGIEPRETVRDSIVDVEFIVSEGRPSNIRFVNVTGNRGTREKVIRREVSIREGDRFKRSALVRTQGDVFRLGFFEDVQIDFQPAESTDVDITLKVKEKSVGTASAGAGYTAESGVTGFLELGHNNILGNGQSLSLHLERGSQRSDYYLSFTEPWFRDTPTLLGFSVFNTERDRDLFDEKRRGASMRVGRPLPWPDYTRGSLEYRLEDVTIRQTGDVITPEDSVALIGVPIGEAVRTSSLQLNSLRNTTNNPFYPSSGTKLSLSTELAGGPFGGSVNFHKHRIEGRAYLPSFTKGVTTMLRGRIGLLGEYGDQNSSVPPYERFRLGGGTTPDPVRGYDDYQIVPPKYSRDVVVGQRLDHLTFPAPGDTDSVFVDVTQRVRYPGGRYMSLYTVEQQFAVVHPLHGVVFFDAGNTWDLWKEIQPFDLKMGVGIGFRLEIPLLGNIGFDYGYGFNRDDGARAVGHFLIGQTSF